MKRALLIALFVSLAGCAAASGNAGFLKKAELSGRSKRDAIVPYRSLNTEQLMLAANQGDAEAMFEIGRRALRGDGEVTDSRKAVFWIERAAHRGSLSAQFRLGILKLRGSEIGGSTIPKNEAEGVAWLRRSAEGGSLRAMTSLASCYRDGTGVPQSYEKAADWLAEPVRQGNAMALKNQGDLYFEGQGVPKDLEKARHLYEQAAEGKQCFAYYRLGLIEEDGLLGERNRLKALEWYRLFAECEPSVGRFHVGRVLILENKRSEGIAEFRAAAKLHDPRSLYALGAVFEHGLGVPKDQREACRWFARAAERGSANGREKLKKCSKH